jgi:Tol biopolymer transport system component
MNCEQVEELLSAYLDNMLASEERRAVAAHLKSCTRCSAALADFRSNDALLKHLPRVSPDPALHERIFSSPEFLELTGTDDTLDTFEGSDRPVEWTVPRLPANGPRRDTPGRPHLVAIPGGRSTAPNPSVRPMAQPRTRRNMKSLRVLIAGLAATLILTLGIWGFIGVNSWFRQAPTSGTKGYGPPFGAGPQGTIPLSAGLRFVFLRGGSLWSVLTESNNPQPERLTPGNVTVAPNWAVRSPSTGSSAGDMLAYIDLQTAIVHTIRSDGQTDIVIHQPLLKAGTLPASVQDTDTWEAILNSLTWSADGGMLAFVADPTGTGQTGLYIYSTETQSVTPVTIAGSVTHPVWSPDGVRLAFEVTNHGATSIIDYNTKNLSSLTIADGIGTGSTASESVLSLDWTPDPTMPMITWSVGTIGQVSSLWIHRVGVVGAGAQELLAGDFAQAIYSRGGDNGVGSWLIITSIVGRAGDVWRIDAVPGARYVPLTSGKQVGAAQWSPDDASIEYLDMLSAGIGTLHVVNASTGSDRLIANGVANAPAPAWSSDGQHLAYSTGTKVGIANIQAPIDVHFLSIKGAPSTLAWSVTSPQRLVVALNDGQQGIYLVDTGHGSTKQVDALGTSGPILWTEIP